MNTDFDVSVAGLPLVVKFAGAVYKLTEAYYDNNMVRVAVALEPAHAHVEALMKDRIRANRGVSVPAGKALDLGEWDTQPKAGFADAMFVLKGPEPPSNHSEFTIKARDRELRANVARGSDEYSVTFSSPDGEHIASGGARFTDDDTVTARAKAAFEILACEVRPPDGHVWRYRGL